MTKKIKRKPKIKVITLTIILTILIIIGIFITINNTTLNTTSKKELEIDYNEYYNDYVITNKDTDIYKLNDNTLEIAGKIYNNVELELNGIYDNNNEYFLIKGLDDNYYIKYDTVNIIENLSTTKNNRYENYIPFNKNIITNDITNFYDENENLLYTINKSYNFEIIIMKDDKYGIIYNNEILYINNSDVSELIDSNNTTQENTKGIAVLNYHFIYEDDDTSCNEEICMSETQFREHMDYIKNNNYFTPTMKELEMYIDGQLQLPKSVVITVDDGRYIDNVKRILEEYQLNGTMFLVSGWTDASKYWSDYMEIHSHTHDMHDVGDCPGMGQGGAIQCFSEEDILNDLNASREELNGTTYFAYPFYEYNDYSIEMLKKAGFTMAFGGEYENGQLYVSPGIDKFKLPRWVMVNYTTMKTFQSYLELGDGY